MSDEKVVRRRRAVLALLVALSVTLLTAYFGERASGTLHVVQRGAQEVLAPVQTGASRAFKPFRDIAGWTGDTFAAKGENDRLRREVAELRARVARAETDRRDVAQLRALDSLAGSETFPDGVRRLSARVIVRSPTVWHAAVGIDKGRIDGVRVDQPVIVADGLVGRISDVTRNTARIALISDERSAVSAQVMPDGASGVVLPEVGRPEDLLLDFIERGRRVRRGATVVTSGFQSAKVESLFPRGIPIGRVKRVEEADLEIYQRVHLEPFADLRRIDFVQVLVSEAGGERAEVAQP